MKSIVIDDNNIFEKKLLKTFDENALFPDDIHLFSKYSTHYLAELIYNKLVSIKSDANESLPILINIDANYEEAKRQNQKGVEILIWLRCKYRINNPIILYSFQNIHQILKKSPEHFIINSEGSYFIQLPYDFAKLKTNSFNPLKNWDNLKKYLKPAFSIDEFRHREANWWGAYRLYNIYNSLFDDKLSLEIFEKKRNSLNAIIAQYIYTNNNHIFSKSQTNYQRLITQFRKVIIQKKTKILYVDDSASLGWETLLKKITGLKEDNFAVIIPEEQNINLLTQEIINKIQSFNPTIVILDLRLFDENDNLDSVEYYSGAKVLQSIKTKFLYLPVIIFTASNKSQNMRKLIELGCEDMWTKEGVDNGIDDKKTLESILSLQRIIYKSINKFKYDIEKKIFETDIKLSRLEENAFKLNSKTIKDHNEDISKWLECDYIFTDTNIWLESEKMTEYFASLFLLYKLCSMEKKTFQIIDDVLLEIMRISKKHITSEEQDIIIVSRFALEKIWGWYNYKKSFVGKANIENYKEKILSAEQEEIHLQDIVNRTDKWYNKIFELFSLHKNNTSLSIKKESREIKDELKSQGKKEYKSSLHADDTFLDIIPNYLKKGKSILFISNDNKFIKTRLSIVIKKMKREEKARLIIISGDKMSCEFEKTITYFTK